MKHLQSLRILVVVLLLTVLCVPASVGALSSTTIKLWIGSASMVVNGAKQPIDAQGTKPVIVEGRTLVPIRAIIEAFAGSVVWEATTRRVTLSLAGNSLELWIGKSNASLNGSSVAVDSANPRVLPVIMGGRTMLPLRFVSESLGIEVQYESVAKMITLTYSAPVAPPPAPSDPLVLQSGWSFEDDGMGGYVVGRVINTSSKTVGFASITFALLDSNGKTVDKGIDITSDLAPGGTWLFKVSILNTDVAKAEFISVGGY
jgi:hypothetical protein